MRWLIALLPCLVSLPLLAQTQVELSVNERYARRNAFDSTYYQPYYRGLTLRPRIRALGESFQFRQGDERLPEVLYQPNLYGTIGVHTSYNGLGLGLSVNIPGSGLDTTAYGRTFKLDLNLDFTARRWYGQFIFSGLQGFYLEDPGQYLEPTVRHLPPQVRPDMGVTQLGFEYTRIFNPRRFTIRTLYNQTEMQTRSAGSFLLQGHSSLFSMYADSSLIPASLRPHYPTLDSATEISLLSFRLAPGYAHTFVFRKRLSLGLLGLLGLGLQRSVIQDGADLHIRHQLQSVLELRTSLNYARPRWFTGFSLVLGSGSVRLEEADLNFARVRAELYVGYRFPQVRILKNWRWLRKIGPVRNWLDG